MRYFAFFLYIFFSCWANASLNGKYLYCERTEQYRINEKENQNENYLFFYFEQNKYHLKKIIKNTLSEQVEIFFQTFNTGKYKFEDNKIKLEDNLIFRKKKLKSELDRNTMVLKSHYKNILILEHLCETTDIKDFTKKYSAIINNSKKFWKNKMKDNKI